MTTVSRVERWFDEFAEGLVGLPVGEAVRDVMLAGLDVEVERPNVHRVRDARRGDVSVVADRHGVVVDVIRIENGRTTPTGHSGDEPMGPLVRAMVRDDTRQRLVAGSR